MEVRGVKAAGGAREFVLPCSNLGIGRVTLRVSRRALQKCWEKDKVADIHMRLRVNSCRGKGEIMSSTKSEGVYSAHTHACCSHGCMKNSFVPRGFE